MIEVAFPGNLVAGGTADREAHVVYTKVQLQQGATKIQRQAGTAAAGVGSSAQLAAQGVQQAAAGVTAGLRASTLGVRDWAAPRLEIAADYTTSTAAPAVSKVVVKKVAPSVSSALRATARQVGTKRRSAVRPAFAWAALAVTVLAGTGAVGALLWRRRRAALAEDSRLDAAAYPTADQDAMAPESTPSEDGMSPPVHDPAGRAW
jgi:hypothetical protein